MKNQVKSLGNKINNYCILQNASYCFTDILLVVFRVSQCYVSVVRLSSCLESAMDLLVVYSTIKRNKLLMIVEFFKE